MQVRLGLPDAYRTDAARLYWEAFGSKLGVVLGPERKGIAYLERAIRADHCIHALAPTGELVGIAGFKTPNGSFSGGSVDLMTDVYGIIGSSWRRFLLRLLQSEIDNERFLVDGICVSRGWRGQGIGTALIDALLAEARWRGYPSVRLDVIDANIRAKALYERIGFLAKKSDDLGLLRHVFGFSRSTTMILDLKSYRNPG